LAGLVDINLGVQHTSKVDQAVLQLLIADNPWLEDSDGRPPPSWWDRRLPDRMIPRLVQAVTDWPVHRKAHLVVGARQVGKSTWLWDRLKREGAPPLLVDCEQPTARVWAQDPALVRRDLEELLEPGVPVLFEEAQHLAEAGLLLKGLVDRGIPNPLYVTGSSSFHLRARTRESLAGRAVRPLLHPLSLAELADDEVPPLAPAVRRMRLRSLALRHAVTGGYPEAWLSDRADLVLARLLDAFVLRDASDLYRVQHLDALRTLLRLVAGQAGDLVNASEWSSICGVARGTVVNHLDLLRESHVLFTVRPFAGGRRAEVTGRPKVYFSDPGLRHAVVGDHSPFEGRQDRGRVLESWVAAELRKRLSPLAPGDVLHFWRSRSGAEVDFVFRQSGDLVGLEVKAGELKRATLSRSSRSFIEAYEPARFYVLNLGIEHAERLGSTDVSWVGPELLARAGAL